MPYSVISNFTFEPLLAAEYAASAFVENLQLLGKALGVIRPLPVDQFQSNLAPGGGEYVDLPYFAAVDSLISRRDLTSTSAPTDLDITGAKDRAVILRRKAGPVKFTEDLFVRGLRANNVEAEIGRQIGTLAAKEVRERILGMIVAAIYSVDDPTANAHVNDVYVASGTKNNLTLQAIFNTRQKLGDRANDLNTIVMRSEQFADVVTDSIGNYKIENIGGFTVVTGLAQAFGMNILLVDDAALFTDGGANYDYFRAILLGPDAIDLIWAQTMKIDAEKRLDFEAPYHRVLANYSFAPHLRGVKWTYTANPTNADFQQAANWTKAYQDHREVLAALFVGNASAS